MKVLRNLGTQFSAPRLSRAVSKGTSVLHIAGHLSLSAVNDAQSILHTGAGDMTLTELTALDWRGVDLVTLSACDSGVRRVVSVLTADGAESDSLVRGLRLRGAKQVMATLWPIDDEAAADLMRHFLMASRHRKI